MHRIKKYFNDITRSISKPFDRSRSASGARFPREPKFYKAVLVLLEIPIAASGDSYFLADELFVTAMHSEAATETLTGRHHLAFQARDRSMVDDLYNATLAHGGRDNGAPGELDYHPGYYAAFVLDPDGNNIESVYRGEATRSCSFV